MTRIAIPSKRSKFGATKVTVCGITFDSKVEAEYYLVLLSRKQAGEIASIRLQPVYTLQERFSKSGRVIRPIEYVADFEIIHLDGSLEAIDVKGHETADFKIKRKLFDHRYPHITLTRMRKVQKFGGWITHEEWVRMRRKEAKKDAI